VVVYIGRQIEVSTRTVGGEPVTYPELAGNADLFQVESEAATTIDLTVSDLSVTPANPEPGSSAIFKGSVVNSGTLTVDPAELVFWDNGEPISPIFDASPLAAGDHSTFSFTAVVEDTGATHTISLIADPDSIVVEEYEDNNMISLNTVLPDIQAAWCATAFSTNTVTVTIGIGNVGVIAALAPFDVELRAGSETGLDYASAPVDAGLANGSEVAVTFVLTDLGAVPESATTTWVVVDAGEDVIEADEDNNTGLVDVPRRPDLTFGPYDLVGAPSQRLVVRNQGPVAASKANVAVYQGSPSGDLLFSTTIPSLMPGGAVGIPVWGSAGDLALVARADPGNDIFEGDESNNLLERTVTFWPRLFLPLVFKDQ
jgi:subtilase family serine protease